MKKITKKKTSKKVVKKKTTSTAAKKKTIKKKVVKKKVAVKPKKKATVKKKSTKKVVKKKVSPKKSSTKKKVVKKVSKKKNVKKKALKKKTVKKAAKKIAKKSVKKSAQKKAVKKATRKIVKKKAVKKSTKEDKKKAILRSKKATLKKLKIEVTKGRDESDRTKAFTPMRIYLNQIEAIPLLTPEEELQLSEIIQLKKRGHKAARERMIRCNLRLVINIAKRYMNLGLPFSDLIEEGNIGLMRAVDKFNYERGYRFSTYASWWIKQSMMRALSNQGKLIRIPVHMFEVMNRWRKVKEYLVNKTGKMPSHKEIARLMKIKPQKVKEIEQVALSSSSSLNAPVSLDGNAELIDLIEDDTHSQPHENLHEDTSKKHIESFLNYVNERERIILIMRFGLYDSDTHTLEETAQRFSITRERVRQIEEGSLKKIRNRLSNDGDRLENYV